MLVGLDEVKNYLRIDGDYVVGLFEGLMAAGQDLCLVVMRCREQDVSEADKPQVRTAILYAVSYLYEHREEADHNAFLFTIRSLLSGVRKEAF